MHQQQYGAYTNIVSCMHHNQTHRYHKQHRHDVYTDTPHIYIRIVHTHITYSNIDMVVILTYTHTYIRQLTFQTATSILCLHWRIHHNHTHWHYMQQQQHHVYTHAIPDTIESHTLTSHLATPTWCLYRSTFVHTQIKARTDVIHSNTDNSFTHWHYTNQHTPTSHMCLSLISHPCVQ